jgi:predicted ATPase/transcriptional regulator with XRE-family HTH domain
MDIKEKDLPSYFGDWLKLRRKELDMTQSELAGKALCSLPGLRKIEAGERRPSKQLAELLGKALQVPPDELATFVKVARGELNVERLPVPGPTRAGIFTVVQAPAVPRTSLPFQPTPFFGREAELAALARLLGETSCRLLTITGMGGMGKTRLAIELASQQQGLFPGGAYFVSLAAVNLPEYIVPAIAEGLKLTFSGSLSPREQLLNYLKTSASKATLLIIDNLEHLLTYTDQRGVEDVTALLKEILLRAPNLKIVATSRERVNLQGEWVFELYGMPFPTGDAPSNFENYSATTLFVQRARQVRADFEVLPGEWASLAKICELTEGAPLAIELASAWVGMLSLDEIAREIGSNLDFLSSSLRDIPERHRSMHVVFDHSWKLLSNNEQQALGRLSVFRGGFSRQAAEQVAGATLPVLSNLVSRTLVRRASTGRFDMHELVRQYSSARLVVNAGEYQDARQQHFDFFLALVESASQGLKGGNQVEWLGRLEEDHDNLRAALDWALELASKKPGDESALRLAGALRWFWRMRGHFHEGQAFLTKALQRSQAKPTISRANALLGLGMLLNALGELLAALQPAEESAAILRELNDPKELAEALIITGLTLVWQGDANAGCAQMEEALAIYRKTGDRRDVAHALYRLGQAISDYRGDVAGRLMLVESAGILESLGEKYLYTSVLISLGILDMGVGEYAIARSRLERALELSRELQHPWGIADALCNLGGIFRIQGKYPSAQVYLEEAQRVYQERGSVWEIDALCALAEIAIAQGYFATARRHLKAASLLLESSGHKWLQVLLGYFQGLLKYYEGELVEAAALLKEMIAQAQESEFKPDLARALVTLGRVRLRLDDPDGAAESCRKGLDLFRQLGHKLGMATALEGLAAVSYSWGQLEQAVMLYGAASQLRDEIQAPVMPVDREEYEARLDQVSLALGEEAFSKAWERGLSLPVEKMVE